MSRRTVFALALTGLWVASPAWTDVAVITSQSAGALSVLDTTSGAVLREIDLPGQPAAIAVWAGGIATVAVGSRTLHLLDPEGREIARRVFAGAPFGVAYDGQADEILVTDAAGPGALHRLSLPDLAVIAQLPAAANPTGIDAAEGYVVVAARDADLALIYPSGCGDCHPRAVAVGHHPFGVTIHQGRAYVTNVLSDDVSVIDLARGEQLARIPTGERPYALAFSGGRGFVTNQYDATLTVFDPDTLQVQATLETGDYPEGIAATADGRIIVANWFSDEVQIFDAGTLALVHQITVPEGPRAFGRFVSRPAPRAP